MRIGYEGSIRRQMRNVHVVERADERCRKKVLRTL